MVFDNYQSFPPLAHACLLQAGLQRVPATVRTTAKNTYQMKSYKLSEAEDLLIGKKGTKPRDEYEFELKLELIHNTNNPKH